jgi:hypothetical protein
MVAKALKTPKTAGGKNAVITEVRPSLGHNNSGAI